MGKTYESLNESRGAWNNIKHTQKGTIQYSLQGWIVPTTAPSFNQLSYEGITASWKSINLFLHIIKLRKIGNGDVQQIVRVVFACRTSKHLLYIPYDVCNYSEVTLAIKRRRFLPMFEKELAFYNQHQHLSVLQVLPNRLELSKIIIELTWISITSTLF